MAVRGQTKPPFTPHLSGKSGRICNKMEKIMSKCYATDTPSLEEFMDQVRPDLPNNIVYEKTQFAKVGDSYATVGPTHNNIPPGLYFITPDSQYGYLINPKVITTRDLIRFPGTITDEIITESEIFWTKRDAYHEEGEPHKRGYLLYGPPGSGKTSLITFLTQDFIRQGHLVFEFTWALPAALNDIKKLPQLSNTKILITIEDIDGFVDQDEQTVLQFLDGSQQMDYMMVVATTNHPEILKGQLKNRPSRFDRVCFVPTPGTEEREVYITKKMAKFNPTDKVIKEMVKDTEGFSLAHIKELIIATQLIGNSYEEVLKRLKSLNEQGPNNNEKDFLTNGHSRLGF